MDSLIQFVELDESAIASPRALTRCTDREVELLPLLDRLSVIQHCEKKEKERREEANLSG